MHSCPSNMIIQKVSLFWCALLIIGLFLAEWVRVLPSIGVAGLFLTALSHKFIQREAIQKWQRIPLLSLVIIFLLHLFSDLSRNDFLNKQVWQDLILQLPFLLLPISFSLLPRMPIAHKNLLWMLLIVCCLLAACGATYNYLLHSQQIEESYLQSKVMPTEPDHIRFSLLISIAILSALVLLQNNLPKKLQYGLIVVTILLFLFLHLLAVRSGLVSMYVAGLAWLGWLGIQQKNWHKALLIFIIGLSLAIGSLLFFTTLQNKIKNTRSDTEQLDKVGAANNYSVTARVYSYDIAWTLIKQHPWVGVGKIKLPSKMAVQYGYRFPEIQADKYILPHNQFLYNLAAYGIAGFLFFILGFYYPLFSAFRKKNILLLLVYLIVTISFTVEYTLESHIGVLIGSFFSLLASNPDEIV